MSYHETQRGANGLNRDLTPSFFNEPPIEDPLRTGQPASGAPPLVGYGTDSTLDLSSGSDAIPTSTHTLPGEGAPVTPPPPTGEPQQLGSVSTEVGDDSDLQGSTVAVNETDIEVLEDESWTLRRVALISGIATATAGIGAGLTWFLINRARANKARKQAEQLAQARALMRMASPATRKRMTDLTTSGGRLSDLAKASSTEAQRFATTLADTAALVAQDIRNRTTASAQDVRDRANVSAQAVRERANLMSDQVKALSQGARGLTDQVNTLRDQAQGLNKQMVSLSKQANDMSQQAANWAIDLWERSRDTALTAYDAAAKTAATAAEGATQTAKVAKRGAKRVKRTATRQPFYDRMWDALRQAVS